MPTDTADTLRDALCVIPSTLAVGEEFTVKVKLRGEIRKVPCAGAWRTLKPALRSPFNLNVERGIHYLDDTLDAWRGELRATGDALDGPGRIPFAPGEGGVFPGDTRAIRSAGGFRWTRPGFHFLRLVDSASGLEFWSNPCRVTERPPAERLYWGDPHWQTFFSDGIRCPEELYAFARDEAFLDFGAISDHVEAVTDRQWEYMIGVTNDFNAPGRFATLVGLEWTSMKCGHRNVYYRGASGPVLRSTEADADTLDKLWKRLDGIEALAVPHHSANVMMGVDWSLGWNPAREPAVEVYSVWGSSECPAGPGNPRPIRTCKGEMPGRHVVDALKRGYRFGFVGGGDIHDGRPGDDLHSRNFATGYGDLWPQGLTAAWLPALTRENLYDAVKTRSTYAASRSRMWLQAELEAGSGLRVRTAGEHGIARAEVIRNGVLAATLRPETDPRIIDTLTPAPSLASGEFLYVRVTTARGEMAWSSPVWG